LVVVTYYKPLKKLPFKGMVHFSLDFLMVDLISFFDFPEERKQ